MLMRKAWTYALNSQKNLLNSAANSMPPAFFRSAIYRLTWTLFIAVHALCAAAGGAQPHTNESLADIPQDKSIPKNNQGADFQAENPLNTVFQKLPDGRIRIGLVTIDSAKRQMSFPAKVNMRDGVVEYAVVAATGKLHESVFATDASPTHIHMAALLLTLFRADEGGEPARLSVDVEWQSNGAVRREPLDHFIAFSKDNAGGREGASLSREAWLYHGSILTGGALTAESEGSIVSLIRDDAALIVNPREGRFDDMLHVPNSRLVPNLGTPVVIYLKSFERPVNSGRASLR